jgi:hypothetical protein
MGTAHYQPLRSNGWIVREPRPTKTEPISPPKREKNPPQPTMGHGGKTVHQADALIGYRLLAIT